jgi:mannose-6-phosphate isomerase-like protein (cupin superfamily)
MSDESIRDREYVLGQELRVTVLTRGAETGGRHDLVLGVNGPGETTALHLHTRYDERLWVIDGELIIWAGDDRVTLGPNGFYTIPMNVPHMLAAGPRGARALNISSPAGFAELIERAATPARLAGPRAEVDPELFMEVTTELGDVVLGPPGTTPDQLRSS